MLSGVGLKVTATFMQLAALTNPSPDSLKQKVVRVPTYHFVLTTQDGVVIERHFPKMCVDPLAETLMNNLLDAVVYRDKAARSILKDSFNDFHDCISLFDPYG